MCSSRRGKRSFSPIYNFLRQYAIAGLFCIALVLLLIRLVTGRLAKSVKEVAKAAHEVAEGRYQEVPRCKSHDEIDALVESFNTMVQDFGRRTIYKRRSGVMWTPRWRGGL